MLLILFSIRTRRVVSLQILWPSQFTQTWPKRCCVRRHFYEGSCRYPRTLYHCGWLNTEGLSSRIRTKTHNISETYKSYYPEMYDFSHHDDVIKWKHFPRNWPFVRGIQRSPVNSPHKGQWRGAVVFPLICAWINGWPNNREAGDLRRHRGHYDVTVIMEHKSWHFRWVCGGGQDCTAACLWLLLRKRLIQLGSKAYLSILLETNVSDSRLIMMTMVIMMMVTVTMG